MIEGYDLYGNLVFKFRSVEEMSVVLNLGLSNLKETFGRDRQVNYGNIIFHKKDPDFVKEFGYPSSVKQNSMDLFDKIQEDISKTNLSKEPVKLFFNGGDITEEYFKSRNTSLEQVIMAGETNYSKEEKQSSNHMDAKDGGKYDEKGNSSHYQSQFMEFIRDQERRYGTVVAMIVCQSNVDKYNQRAGLKEGVPAEKDLTKRDWYLKAVNHFKAKIDYIKENNDINDLNVPGRNKYVCAAEEVFDAFRAELTLDYPDYIPLSVAIEKK
jgi:hypothetical protein